MTAYGQQAFAKEFNVSRETSERLAAFVAILEMWQRRINLIGRRTLPDIWHRHIWDSAQLLALARPTGDSGGRDVDSNDAAAPMVWTDLGSGGGFPGLILAILGAGEMHLVESDARKCAFLREAAQRTATAVSVHHGRIEEITPWPSDVVTARALAPLVRLLPLAQPFVHERTCSLFLKGQDVESELTKAAKYRKMNFERIPSQTSEGGVILRIRGRYLG